MHLILYFSGYKTVFFPFQNNPKYLDPSYKMDLDIWDCFGKGKTDHKAELHKINLDVWGHSRNGKAMSYKQRNMVGEENAYCAIQQCQKIAGGQMNSVDPHQIFQKAVLSGSSLFAYSHLS